MAFNKTKALESALESLNRGKLAQAISDYQQILRYDPKDQVALMTLGDLFARQNDMPQAIDYFERLAQVYLSDGFNSKAIAIYKKIVKLAPNELLPLEHLADLYVQQGVMSEARPLYLQIAEAHLKANRAPKAVELLRRLIEVEPENLRVQMRLAELYNVMGQKQEAAQTYLNYAHRLHDQGQYDEAEKLVVRVLDLDAKNADALKLKARILGAAGRAPEAIPALEKLPESHEGGELTDLYIHMLIRNGQGGRAVELSRKLVEKDHKRVGIALKTARALQEEGYPADSFALLKDMRDAAMEAGEQDAYIQVLSSAAGRLPGRAEPLEALADLARRTGDPFRLEESLTQLVDTYAEAGALDSAEKALEELIALRPDSEKLQGKKKEIAARRSGEHVARAHEPVVPAPRSEAGETRAELYVAVPGSAKPEEPPAAPAFYEEGLSEETQRYISQALTDVDLFSSYGLTQKATALLEGVLERAPKHVPTLERLMDIHLGGGNEERVVDLASKLEKIYLDRGDMAGAERFTELRQRFERMAGAKAAEHPTPPAPAAMGSAASSQEFEIPAAEAEPVEAAPPAPVSPRGGPQPVPAAEHEVDLSEEWEALAQEVEESTEKAAHEAAPAGGPTVRESHAGDSGPEFKIEEEPAPTQTPQPPPAVTPEPATASSQEFELELVADTQEEARAAAAQKEVSTEDFLGQLIAEIEAQDVAGEQPASAGRAPAAAPPPPAAATHPAAPKSVARPKPVEEPAPVAAAPRPIMAEAPTLSSLGELDELFAEFRSELDAMGDENEDLETHYNLGIAYREMGLLDEAIGEFQKVAKAVQRGKPFRYAMQCSTLLGLSFMDKGEPNIAVLWYSKALEIPGLEQETILALRYDLGVAQEQAGESRAALDSFRQVYAMNIDYRDVAERIATLQKR